MPARSLGEPAVGDVLGVAADVVDAGRQLERREQTWEREGDRSAIMTLRRAATVEPAAAEMLRDFMQNELAPPLFQRLNPDHPELRASLATSQIIGLGMARYVLRLEPLASMTLDEVVAWIAPTLQRYLTGKAP
jgi:hypothetical protein